MSEAKPIDIQLPKPAAWILGEFNAAAVVCTQRHPRASAVYTAEQVRAAVLAERERCAKLCETIMDPDGDNSQWVHEHCAAAIRKG